MLAVWFTVSAGAESPLYWAAMNNDALAAWSLTQETPFELDPFTAADRGSGEVIQVLTWRGVPLTTLDAAGRNLLFPAVALGRIDLFERLEAAGVPPDHRDHLGQGLVHLASTSPHPEMIRIVLSRGLAPDTRSTLGITPLMMACRSRQREEAAILLEWGAVPEDEDYQGRSVRDWAVLGGDPEIVAMIDAALTPWTIESDDAVPLP